MAEATAKIVVQNSLFRGRKRLSSLVVPSCIFTTPEVAHVGINARQAAETQIPVHTSETPMKDVDRSSIDLHTSGFAKIYLYEGLDHILGATVVGQDAGEIIGDVAMAMNARLGLAWLADIIPPYPTRSEVIKKAAAKFCSSLCSSLYKRAIRGWLRFRLP
jgi:pyruvate/2-oxoglutarate dehydrogenase complex dihydrolipoamide dehydrogenase (E3) component